MLRIHSTGQRLRSFAGSGLFILAAVLCGGILVACGDTATSDVAVPAANGSSGEQVAPVVEPSADSATDLSTDTPGASTGEADEAAEATVDAAAEPTSVPAVAPAPVPVATLEPGVLISQIISFMGFEETPELVDCAYAELEAAGFNIAQIEADERGNDMFVALIRCNEAVDLIGFFGSPVATAARLDGIDESQAGCATFTFITKIQEGSFSDSAAFMSLPDPTPELISSIAAECDVSEADALAILTS